MANIFDWSPRVGASGDDRFTLPSSAIFNTAGTMHTDGAGSTDHLICVRTNTYLNQIAAEVNRRLIINGTPAALVNFFTSGQKTDSTFRVNITNIKSRIDTIRSAEGLSAYTWTQTYTATRIFTALHINELRKALHPEKYVMIANTLQGFSGYARVDNPYGTFVSHTQSASLLSGKANGVTQANRHRRLLKFARYGDVEHYVVTAGAIDYAVTCVLNARASSGKLTTLEGFEAAVYRLATLPSNTDTNDVTPYTDSGNRTLLADSFADGSWTDSVVNEIPLNSSAEAFLHTSAPAAPMNIGLMLVTENELAGAGADPAGAGNSYLTTQANPQTLTRLVFTIT